MKKLTAMLALLAVSLMATSAMAQFVGQSGITFSVDFQGPTAFPPGPIGAPDFFGGIPIDEGSVLTPGRPGPPGPNPPLFPGPLPPPGVMVGSGPGAPGSVPGGLGILPGQAVELDALSYGRDPINSDITANRATQLFFSVDEFATGIFGTPAPPAVWTESFVFGPGEASADVFGYLGPVIFTPLGPTIGNTAAVDGDGIPPSGMPGVGLFEPNFPTPGQIPDEGDNLDAVDMDTTFRDVNGKIYFSLDSHFPDPLEALAGAAIPNTATALANGFVGGDVLVTSAGGLPIVYAPAAALGLDIRGTDTDDLDALALWENGDGRYQPGVDQLLFSVRRGSAVIGAIDSLQGLPIEEGDVLVPPGAAGGLPGIFIPAELLGLATLRSGGNEFPFGDDLDAMDVVPEPSTVVMLICGGLCLLSYVWRRRRMR